MNKITMIMAAVAIACAAGWVGERIKSARNTQALISADKQLQELRVQLMEKVDRSDQSDTTHQTNSAKPSFAETLSEATPRPEPLIVSTVDMSNAESEGPPPMTDAALNAIERFDYAMDREFNRLDKREESSADSSEVATINTIKEKLGELDELYRRADLATNAEERITIRKEMQDTMGSIIGLSRRDRNERLSKLATDIGYTDPQAVEQFVREIDRVYRETHMDWTKLFNRTPPAMGPAGDRSISPGMQPGEGKNFEP